MSVSFATLDPTKMELTPMRVSFDGVDLGGTLKNVSISIKAMKAEIKADQMGETVIDRRISGHEMKITTEIVEVREKDKWKVVLPHLKKVVSGPNEMIYSDSQVGRADTDDAKILLLHPLALPDADVSGDFKFFKAVASGESEIVYGPGEQATLKMVWNVLPDFSTVPAKFFIHGDPGIGLIAATAAQVYAGTGNGLMSALTAYSGYTVTETITVTVVTAAVNGGIFNVNGSVSGPLGLATVGVAFIAPANEQVVSFLISDGATDFVVGDVFTLTMVAANYA